jgi:hypothetical protein
METAKKSESRIRGGKQSPASPRAASADVVVGHESQVAGCARGASASQGMGSAAGLTGRASGVVTRRKMVTGLSRDGRQPILAGQASFTSPSRPTVTATIAYMFKLKPSFLIAFLNCH